MVKQLEAVYEQGVLRPLEPLSLTENQHVLVTIKDMQVPERSLEWLDAHGSEYRGQWVALQGDALISHGPRAQVVLDEAQGKGVQRPLLVHVEEDFGLPSIGWF